MNKDVSTAPRDRGGVWAGRNLAIATALALIAAVTPASAEDWISAELPAAWALSDPQGQLFSPGALPALGFYSAITPWAAAALRLRAGALGDGSAPTDSGRADPDRASLATFTLATRVHLGPAWTEVAVGGGFTGDDPVPVLELGAGALIRLGGVHLGPAFRLIYVREPAARAVMDLKYGSATLALIGIEARLASTPSPRASPSIEAAAVPPEAPPAPAAAPRDRDRLVDVELASCRRLAAVIDGAIAGDGCTRGGTIVVESDRLVLSEHILFNRDRARVRSSARAIIASIADAWNAEFTWDRLIIAGHTDTRGPGEYNRWLSQERASRVRDALIEAGVSPERIEAVGYGADRPLDPSDTEAAHARNRRVEFIAIPRGKSP